MTAKRTSWPRKNGGEAPLNYASPPSRDLRARITDARKSGLLALLVLRSMAEKSRDAHPLLAAPACHRDPGDLSKSPSPALHGLTRGVLRWKHPASALVA